MGVYTTLTFNNHEDFETYKNTVNLKPENIALSKNFRSEDIRITVVIRTELPIPNGSLIVKTKKGREMVIQVSSGFAREVPGNKFP